MKNKNKNRKTAGFGVISAQSARSRNLVKIGELAREYEILPSTINFYTREGLLREDARSVGGYRLYDRERALGVLRRIEYLQTSKRLTIDEIKKIL